MKAPIVGRASRDYSIGDVIDPNDFFPNAEYREHEVQKRAQALAKAFIKLVNQHADREQLPSLWEINAAVTAFRDLIDKGVLK
jgi:hypothetical protein